MVVACENCHSTYPLETRLLKPCGSRVQCPGCFHVTFVRYPDAAVKTESIEAASRVKREGRAVLIAGCLMLFIPGALIFAFPGVMSPYWQTTFGVGKAEVGRLLFYMLIATGIFMFLVGRLLQRFSPRKLTAFGGLICGLSTIMLAYVPSMNAVYGWAFLIGISTSLTFVPAMSVVQFWYPQHKGGATGLVSMIYGVSAAIMGPVFGWLVRYLDYHTIVWLMGAAAGFAVVLTSFWIRFPQKKKATLSAVPAQTFDRSLTASQSLKTRSFWILWLTWALAGSAGISIVTVGPEFGLSQGMTIQRAVVLLSTFNITNGVGRFLGGYVSDIVGRKPTLFITFLLAGLSYFGLPYMDGLWLWATATTLIGLSFGTLFGVIAALVSDCFGLRYFGAIFGLIYTAYGFFAGAIGPWLSGYILDVTAGHFTYVFFYLGSLLIVSALLIPAIRRHV